jgi:hypothetical protein
MVALLYPSRKVRSVTDTSGHIQFLGWQPPLGEVLFLVVLALFPWWWRWLSRTRDIVSDRISSLSANRKAKQVVALELKITNLKEYNDRKVLAHFFRGMSGLILLVGLMIVVSIFAAQNDILMNTLQITDFLKIPASSFLSIAQGVPGETIMIATETLYTIYTMVLFFLVLFTFAFVAALFQEMADFSDPPKAIQRLEERINALRAKNT